MRKPYEIPRPYFGDKRVCFECIQIGAFKAKTCILSNHKGFLCEKCARKSKSDRVNLALAEYYINRTFNQPWIGDLAEEILRVTDSGFMGNAFEFFAIIREGKHNHLMLENVRLVLELLSEEKHLSESYDFSDVPVYFDRTKLTKLR